MQDNLPNLLPKHNIRSHGGALKRLRRDMADSYRPSVGTRPHILRVPMRDRFELTDFIALLVADLGLGQGLRIVANDRELNHRMFEDTHPDAIVVMHENIGRWLQDEHVRRYADPNAIRPKFELVITTRDPGDLMRMGTWSPDFRRLFLRTFYWPSTPSRGRDWLPIFQSALGVLAKQFGQSCRIDESGSARLQAVYKQDPPESVKDIVRLAERCAKRMVADSGSVITPAIIDDCRSRPRASLPPGDKVLQETGTD